MSSLITQDFSPSLLTAIPDQETTAPAWSPAQPATESQPGLSDDQRALDQSIAEEAGMGPVEVGTLSAFGLRPAELDPAAATRMATGLQRLQALLACEDGDAAACDQAGPGLVGQQTWQSVLGDSGEDLVVEDGEFTLRLSTRTTPDGQTERTLFYEDIDGTFLSGLSTDPLEIAAQQPAAEEAPEAPAAAEEGLQSFLEGALLGDFAGNDSWSAVAGQTAVGFIPIVGQIADARDTLAAVREVAEGKDGAWMKLGAAAVGWIPGVGDALKGSARVGRRVTTEIAEEVAERTLKEGVQQGEKHAAREGFQAVEERVAMEDAEEGTQAASRLERVAPSRQPDPNAVPGGSRTKLKPSDKAPENIRALNRENESADALARNGYDIEQNPSVPGSKNPDYRIEGKIFDNIAPNTDRPINIWSRAKDKIDEGQTKRSVLNLDDSAVDIEELRTQFARWSIEGLQEVLVVRGGQIISLYP